MKKIILLVALFATTLNTFAGVAIEPKKETEKMFLVKTEFGNMVLKLYNETPKHRDNFIKLVNEKFYDSLLFHRVISNFMIQGGDPTSKAATPDAMLGNGENGYTIPAEFNSKYIHKKGALAAARMGDDVNPLRNSSGCQFYIVQGHPFSEADLGGAEDAVNNQTKNKIFAEFINKPENLNTKNTLIRLQKAQNQDSLTLFYDDFRKYVETEYAKGTPFKYTPEQRKAYVEVGGTPHLDMGYTVFGEVVSGLEIIDRIAAVEKGANDRPKKNVKMAIEPYTPKVVATKKPKK